MKELLVMLACAQKVSIVDVENQPNNISEITIVVECDTDRENVGDLLNKQSKEYPVWNVVPTTYNVEHVPHVTKNYLMPDMVWEVFAASKSK